MKKLHPTYGVQVNFSDISDRAQLVELVKQHSLVVVNNINCIDTKEQFMSYVNGFGPVLPTMRKEVLNQDEEFENKALILLYFDKQNALEVDDIKFTVGNKFFANTQFWHQDAASYYGKSEILGFATVKLENYHSVDKTSDTSFSSSQTAFDSFSPAFKDFLRGLTVELTSNWLNNQGPWIEQVLENNLKSMDFKKLVTDLYRLKSKMGKKTVKPLVTTSPWGTEYLDFDPSSYNRIVNLSEKESNNLVEFLTNCVTDYEYCYNHVWQENQMIIYDNTRLLHRFLDNASGPHTRSYWRLQVEIKDIIPY